MPHPPFIILDEKSDKPLYRRIYENIRRSILSGEFLAGRRLPATRQLAKQLGVSRMTVTNAYDQLLAEGYLESRTGAGTFVAEPLPEEFLNTRLAETSLNETENPSRELHLSKYGKSLFQTSDAILKNNQITPAVPFQHGLTAAGAFPIDVWSKIAGKTYRTFKADDFGYGEPCGFYPLREAVAAYLKSFRAVSCTPEQVIITTGAQHAFDLVGRILLEPKKEFWIEDPCHSGAKQAFQSTGAKLVAVTVDENGFDLSAALKLSRGARLVHVTPSHQFPLGHTMTLARRMALLEWARAAEAWIIEDDYDSEFRYAGRPLPSLQGLDRNGRVIYIGSFSKTVFPALRLGCLVVPPDLIEVFSAARVAGAYSPLVDQAILTEFIHEGHFARHIRRMRKLYEERQEILIGEIEKQLGGRLEVKKAAAGMHVIGWLPEGVSDRETATRAAAINLKVAPVSAYSENAAKNSPRGGLLLGYTAFDEKQIKQGVEKLVSILR